MVCVCIFVMYVFRHGIRMACFCFYITHLFDLWGQNWLTVQTNLFSHNIFFFTFTPIRLKILKINSKKNQKNGNISCNTLSCLLLTEDWRNHKTAKACFETYTFQLYAIIKDKPWNKEENLQYFFNHVFHFSCLTEVALKLNVTLHVAENSHALKP